MGGSWYDDGPIDHGISITGKSSGVRNVLKSATPDDVIKLLDHTFQPAGLTSLTLPYVLEVLISLKRMELAPPLLDRIAPTAGLPDAAWIRVAALAGATGRSRMAADVIRRHGTGFVAEHEYDLLACGTTQAAADLLLKYAPTLALRSMRSSRSRSVRRDEDERIAGRLNLLANAHQALGRTRRVSALTSAPLPTACRILNLASRTNTTRRRTTRTEKKWSARWLRSRSSTSISLLTW